MLSDAELVEIEKRCEAATDGPWQWTSCGEKDYCFVLGQFALMDSEEDPPPGHIETERYDESVEDRYVETAFCNENVAESHSQHGNADFDFISHARTDVPKLLDEVRYLKYEVHRLKADLAGSAV